jgi:DNA-binding PadR family transcriptional regulator
MGAATFNFQEPTLLILAALAGGDLHGYGIIKEVEALSDGRVRLSPGTLYGALDRLKNDGLVETAGEERIDGRLRRYYRLTDAGASALQGEIDRQERVTEIARAKLQTRLARRSQPVLSVQTAPPTQPAGAS